jgi:hypothetical protein
VSGGRRWRVTVEQGRVFRKATPNLDVTPVADPAGGCMSTARPDASEKNFGSQQKNCIPRQIIGVDSQMLEGRPQHPFTVAPALTSSAREPV